MELTRTRPVVDGPRPRGEESLGPDVGEKPLAGGRSAGPKGEAPDTNVLHCGDVFLLVGCSAPALVRSRLGSGNCVHAVPFPILGKLEWL